MLAVAERHRTCLTCREQLCCYYYNITPTGADIWRIVSAMHLDPSDFLRYYETSEPAQGRFMLSPNGAFCVMTLLKRTLPEPLPSPCIFLLRSNDGASRCGLGDLRPAECLTFPVYRDGDRVEILREPEGCVKSWSPEEIDAAEEEVQLKQQEDEDETYGEIVAHWNGYVRTSGEERTFPEFCAYLLNCYAEAEARL